MKEEDHEIWKAEVRGESSHFVHDPRRWSPRFFPDASCCLRGLLGAVVFQGTLYKEVDSSSRARERGAFTSACRGL